jgi:glycosyltransferase involved in cell wall biosynthesis
LSLRHLPYTRLESCLDKGLKVSVIVPAYNVEKYIDECILSIMAQTYPNIETIVVDDESTDGTLEHLRKYKKSIVLIEKKKANVSVTRNVGLRAAKGSYIAFCDADDYWNPNKLQGQISLLESHPEIGLCYTNNFSVDDSGKTIGRSVTPSWNRKKYIDNPFVMLSSILTRSSLIDQIGYFDEMLGFCEDFDFILRLSEVAEFARLNSFLTYRRERPDQLTRNRYEMIKGRASVFLKHKMRTHFIKAMWGLPLYGLMRHFSHFDPLFLDRVLTRARYLHL